MESEELIELMDKIEEKGIAPDTMGERIKVPYDILKLYANSGPVPVTILNNLKKLLEEENNGSSST